jgi:hypothetical protein
MRKMMNKLAIDIFLLRYGLLVVNDVVVEA